MHTHYQHHSPLYSTTKNACRKKKKNRNGKGHKRRKVQTDITRRVATIVHDTFSDINIQSDMLCISFSGLLQTLYLPKRTREEKVNYIYHTNGVDCK